MWEVVENAADNIQGKKQFAKSTMSQIKEVKHFSHIYTFVTLTFRTELILVYGDGGYLTIIRRRRSDYR